jgi:hypothetical protein
VKHTRQWPYGGASAKTRYAASSTAAKGTNWHKINACAVRIMVAFGEYELDKRPAGLDGAANMAEQREFLDFMNERSREHMRQMVREVCEAIDNGTINNKGAEFENAAEAFAATALFVGVEEALIDEIAIRTKRGRKMFARMQKH